MSSSAIETPFYSIFLEAGESSPFSQLVWTGKSLPCSLVMQANRTLSYVTSWQASGTPTCSIVGIASGIPPYTSPEFVLCSSPSETFVSSMISVGDVGMWIRCWLLLPS